MTNRSEIFRSAHEFARREMKAAPAFYGSYTRCFAECLKAVYATQKYEAACDAKYGVGMRPSFQVIEPATLWA